MMWLELANNTPLHRGYLGAEMFSWLISVLDDVCLWKCEGLVYVCLDLCVCVCVCACVVLYVCLYVMYLHAL